jgi:hypothetical protein
MSGPHGFKVVPRPADTFGMVTVGRGTRTLVVVTLLLTLLVLIVTPSSAPAAGRKASGKASVQRTSGKAHLPSWLRTRRTKDRAVPGSAATTPRPDRLRFGIYPGGGAGAVGPRGEPIPEDPVKRLAALQQLRAAGPFVLHLYEDYRRPADGDAIPAWLQAQVREATAAGFEVEMVLRYRPSAATGDVAGFASFVRRRVRQYGADEGVTALQITNEANVTVAPDAADGWYAGARRALVQGVVAADDEARRAGLDHLQIGFNWAAGLPALERAFFSDLRRIGGKGFAAAVDWVGVDHYPGTWGPPLPLLATGGLAGAVRSSTIATMRAMRDELLPAAGLDRAAIRFAESGYPTDALRTEAMQVTVMTATVEAIHEFRDRYRVTDYRWFDLRDADSAHASFESHYGITRDDYSPKRGFSAYRGLVARLG